uniref:hypothetical protein n=1 Tax=Anoxybacteroides voinovskiense TaxID=230470 RepID=UPI001E3650D8|nr:hypothetical protein [Anoxybacillus voinovskiensis]
MVTEASCHDRTAAETVMTQIPHPFHLGDKGFISSELQKKLYEAYQIAFWTPSHKTRNIAHRHHGRDGSNRNGKSLKRCSLSSSISIV